MVGSATDVVEAYSRKVEIDRQEDVDPSSRSGSGEGEVTLIEVLDASGETEAVRARDAVTVRVHYTMNQPIEQPVFGVAGHTLDGIEVSAAISRITFIPDKLDDTGFVDMHVPALVLLPGTYDITAYITNFGGRPPVRLPLPGVPVQGGPGRTSCHGSYGGVMSLGATWDLRTF